MKKVLRAFGVYLSLLLFMHPHIVAADMAYIEPLCSNSPGIRANAGAFGVMLDYFSCISSFLYDIAVGVCVLWVLFGGIKMIASGGDNSDLYGKGKDHIVSAISALVVLFFAPVLLRYINGSAYS
jgi:hypothetical protein